jgi:hypothetical protein
MTILPHSEPLQGYCLADFEEHNGTICLLLKDGRLIGPFKSADAARYWCSALDLVGYSTYDLIAPEAAK